MRIIEYVIDEDEINARMLSSAEVQIWLMTSHRGIYGTPCHEFPIELLAIKQIGYEDLILDPPTEKPPVPRKQLAFYSHKPKGVKRIYKTQKR